MTKCDRKEKSQLMYAAVGVGVVCLIVGFPLWWKTTAVYRVSLPYNDMFDMANYKPEFNSHLTVVFMSDDIGKQDLATFTDRLEDKLESSDSAGIVWEYTINTRNWLDEEKQIYSTSVTVKDFTTNIEKSKIMKDVGHYKFYIFSPDNVIHIKDNYITNQQSAYLIQNGDMFESLDVIYKLMTEIFVPKEMLDKSYNTKSGELHRVKHEKRNMRAVGYKSNYELVFTLINPQPDIIRARWDIEAAIDNYLKPFRDVMKDYSTLTIRSQVLHYASVTVKPTKHKSSDFYFLKPDELPHLINPIERDLASFASTDPSLNFIVYIPQSRHMPLYVYDRNGDRADTNAFLSPRWGGVLIHNVPSNGTELPHKVDIDMKRVAEVFVGQLKVLLGVSPTTDLTGFQVQQPGPSTIHQWEINAWLLRKTIENIASSKSTILSLAQLLGQIRNMVINDAIGNEVHIAVDSIKKTDSLLKSGHLKEAFDSSKMALKASETAFFDPSLLELLYFPEDQKFAIYIPLFLPVCLPILGSLYKAFLYLRDRNRC